MLPKNNAAARKWLSRVWLLILFISISYAMVRNPALFREILLKVDWNSAAIAIFFIIAGKACMIILVRQLLSLRGYSKSIIAAWKFYSMGDISKYLPGGVWSAISRVAVYRASGISVEEGAKLIFIETAVIVIVSFLSGLILYFGSISLVVAGIIAVGMLLTAKRSPQIHLISTICLTQFLAWIAFGFSYAILLPEFSMTSAGIFNIAFSVGTVAVFAPAGLGVREMVIAALSSSGMEFLQFAAIHRVLWMICDFLVFAPILVFHSTENA